MNKSLTFFFIGVWILGLSGCIPTIKIEEEPTLGSLNMDQFLVLGDRYVAGLSNGTREAGGLQGLYESAQKNSFPSLMAGQLAALKRVERKDTLIFRQHLLPDPGSGFFTLEEIAFRECDGAVLSEKLSFVEAQPDWIEWRPEDNNIHNLGIPQMKVSHLFDKAALEMNPFFQRMKVRGSSPQSYADLLEGMEPSLVVVWLGMEDLLSHAIRGGSNSAFPLTPTNVFAENLSRLLDSLEAKSPEKWLGLIGNLPDLTEFPYFTAIDSKFISSEDCKESGAPIFYESSDGRVKTANEETCLLLPLWEQLGKNVGSGGALGLSPENPVPNYLVLDEEEKERIRSATQSYNQVIDSLVDGANAGRNRPQWILTNLEKAFRDLERGFTQGGLEVSMKHLSGGVFSLDGTSLTHRGNAFLANEFMESIDDKARQGVRLNAFNLSDFSGVVYP